MTSLHYLDHAASAPLRAEARDAMLPLLTECYGNPSSSHASGREARVRLERARREVAEALDADPRDVYFTSGGTEADNLAVLGAVLAAPRHGRAPHAVVTAVEHKAVLAAAHAGEVAGAGRTILPVDQLGQPDLGQLAEALRHLPAIVSTMWVNNETGVCLPVREVAERCAAAGVPLHSDAVQAIGRVPVSATAVDALTISGHKIGAPKGIGALLLRDPGLVDPLQHGGSQQGGVRPGTENIAGAVALGTAVRLAVEEREREAARLARLRDQLERGIRALVPDAMVLGAEAPRAPHISAIAIPGTTSGTLLTVLDALGVAASAGSACTTGSPEPSHVLLAMGLPRDLALGFVRLSLGSTSTPDDVAAVPGLLAEAVARARRLAGVLNG